MTDTVVIDKSSENPNPSLEETAVKMGIDPNAVDSTAQSQTAKEPSQKILGKFEDQAALEKAYTELEKKLGSTAKTDETKKEEDKSEEKPASNDDTKKKNENVKDQAKEVVEKAGLDFDSLSEKYWENGSLDDSDYETLDKAGIPKELVDQFIAGQEAILSTTRETVFKEVGGEDNYSSMIEWARDNYKPGEIKAYDNAISGSDQAAARLAVLGLKARYEAAVGFEPTRAVSGDTSRSGGERYESIAQLQEDMRNPLYAKDSAFRKKVEQRLARSDIM